MLINKKAVKDYIWNRLEADRPALKEKFTQIAACTYVAIEAKLMAMINAEIQNHPSVGKTFKVEP